MAWLWLLVPLAGFVGFVVGAVMAARFEREKAIGAGVGRYAVNPTTGVTTFVYGDKHDTR